MYVLSTSKPAMKFKETSFKKCLNALLSALKSRSDQICNIFMNNRDVNEVSNFLGFSKTFTIIRVLEVLRDLTV